MFGSVLKFKKRDEDKPATATIPQHDTLITKTSTESLDNAHLILTLSIQRTGLGRELDGIWDTWPTLRERSAMLLLFTYGVWPGRTKGSLADEALVKAVAAYRQATDEMSVQTPFAAYLGAMLSVLANGFIGYQCIGHGARKEKRYEPVSNQKTLPVWVTQEGIEALSFERMDRIDGPEKVFGMRLALATKALPVSELTIVARAGYLSLER